MYRMARFWEWQLIRVDSQSRSFRCPRLSQSHRLKPCVPAILRHLVTNSIVRYASSAPYWQSPSDHATQILLRRSGNLFQVSPYSTPPYPQRNSCVAVRPPARLCAGKIRYPTSPSGRDGEGLVALAGPRNPRRQASCWRRRWGWSAVIGISSSTQHG